MIKPILTLSSLASLCVFQAASAQPTILGAQRSIYAAAGGDASYEQHSDSINSTAPFASSVSACGASVSGASGCADASQSSQLSAKAIVAFGSAGASTTTDATDLEQSVAHSVMVVRFRVAEVTRYRLRGSISSNYAGSSVVLFHASGSTVHQFFESLSTTEFDESGSLAPGEYELHALADASVDPSSPISSIGASYQTQLQLGLPCPADFDADGAVDFFDYDQFVRCFEGSFCPPGQTADFDADGTTDFFDYDAFVRAFETPC